MLDLGNLPQIHPEELTLIFISNYYDAPIERLAYYQKQIVRFICTDETLFTPH